MALVGVFGANGFIGRHLTRALVARGHETACFGRRFPLDFEREFDGRVQIHTIDLHDDIHTHARLQGVTHVVQLINSSNAAMGNTKIIADMHSNLLPHVSFIKSCIMAGVRSFTFLSSGGTVYGKPQSVPITEDHPTLPLNSYGMTKLVTEQYLRMLCRDTDMGFSILRVANPYGPGQTGLGGQGLIGTILQKYKRNEAITIFGDGLAERDYLYIEDAVDAIVRTVEQGPLNDVVNIGNGKGYSILEVLSAVERALGQPLPRIHIPNRSTDALANILDVTKAKRMLGWETTTDFETGVARTIEWNIGTGPS